MRMGIVLMKMFQQLRSLCDNYRLLSGVWKYTRHDRIGRHKKYHLILESYSDNAPVVNGVKVIIPGYTGGFCLDSCTT